MLSAQHRVRARSYLSEILDIVNGTGRRIPAVCQLQFADLRLDDDTPHGSIRWRAETDKMRRKTVVPINAAVRAAIDRILSARLGIGTAHLFPCTSHSGQPLRYETASEWLKKAERLAGLEHIRGSLWHAYRRKWATERKHLPHGDVAAAGGWASARTLTEVYQQADAATMLAVVLNPAEVREIR